MCEQVVCVRVCECVCAGTQCARGLGTRSSDESSVKPAGREERVGTDVQKSLPEVSQTNAYRQRILNRAGRPPYGTSEGLAFEVGSLSTNSSEIGMRWQLGPDWRTVALEVGELPC